MALSQSIEGNWSYADKEIERQVDFAAGQFVHARFMYIDIAGGLVEGLLLSQILFWFQPGAEGKSKIRVFKNGIGWLVKKRSDWYDEIRITEKQYVRAIRVLQDKGFVEIQTHKFNNTPMTHIRPIDQNIQKAVRAWKNRLADILNAQRGEGIFNCDERDVLTVTKGTNQLYPKGRFNCDQRDESLTEITTENTSEITNRENTPLTPLGETERKKQSWNFKSHSNTDNLRHLESASKDPSIKYLKEHDDLFEYLYEWLEYKDQRKNKYVELSLMRLCKKFKAMGEKYGASKVQDVVNCSIENGYQGLVWDRIEKEESFKKTIADKREQDRLEWEKTKEAFLSEEE